LTGKNIFLVNPSLFKTPQEVVLVTHKPEREFILQLIDHSQAIESWIKSPDSNFYSLDYEFWKKGKDRVRRQFNPDFFIKTSINRYIKYVNNSLAKKKLREIENLGIEDLIFVVEIKGEDDYREVTLAKEEAGRKHFESINKALLGKGLQPFNPADLADRYTDSFRQHYLFSLLRIEDFTSWFKKFEDGTLVLS